MEVEVIAAVLFHHVRRRKKRTRRYWIHPMFLERSTRGAFHLLSYELRKHDSKFFSYTRMSVESFDQLLQLIRNEIQGRDTNFRQSIRSEENLMVTLRYLATGCSFGEFSHNYRLGRTTVRTIIRQVCSAIWTKVKDISLREPTEEEWKTVAETFEKHAQFPNCIGAVDGKHIRIDQPPRSGSLYCNYKRFFSIVLLAICDADYKFISIDVGAYGKCSDSSIFKESAIYEKLVKKELKIPDKCPISATNDTPMPYAFVGDEAFPLLQNLMRPYPGNNLSHEKKIFNYRLSRARRYIEYTFGILANKWRIFHRPLDVHRFCNRHSEVMLCITQLHSH